MSNQLSLLDSIINFAVYDQFIQKIIKRNLKSSKAITTFQPYEERIGGSMIRIGNLKIVEETIISFFLH